MRCVSSRFFTASPRSFAASMISSASLSRALLPGRKPRVLRQPAHRQRGGALGAHLDRHLIRGSTDAPRLHLDSRADVLDGAAEHRQGVVARLRLDHVERSVDDAFRGALLPAEHDDVREAPDHAVLVLRIGLELSLGDVSSSGHSASNRRERPDGTSPDVRPAAREFTWAVWPRTSTDFGVGPSLPWCRACRARCGSARPEGP